MHLVGHTTLGIAILLLLGLLVIVKRVATGSVLRDKPPSGLGLWFVHGFNLFFLLVANPLAAVLLLTRRLEDLDPTQLSIQSSRLLLAIETAGMALYLLGCLLMIWALTTLGGSYQLGGSTPRTRDRLRRNGPYRLIRHPMYTAALCISLGLACLLQSLICLAVHALYLALILCLIPLEEQRLRSAYGDAYAAYRKEVRALVPFLY